jgi:hypothetical protein
VFDFDESGRRDEAVGVAINPGTDATAVSGPPDFLPVAVAVVGIEVFRKHRVSRFRAAVHRDVAGDKTPERVTDVGWQQKLEFSSVLSGVHGESVMLKKSFLSQARRGGMSQSELRCGDSSKSFPGVKAHVAKCKQSASGSLCEAGRFGPQTAKQTIKHIISLCKVINHFFFLFHCENDLRSFHPK